MTTRDELLQDLIDKGYMYYTNGYKRGDGKQTEPLLHSTPKWTTMIRTLLEIYPQRIIVPEMIKSYIAELE